MEAFPKSKIKPLRARLSGRPNEVSLEIFLAPFILELGDYKEEIETSIRLEPIMLPTLKFDELQNKVFRFSVNPTPGYVDGSVYFFGAHHPVDVTEIRFGEKRNDKLPILLKTKWLLEFENSGFKNFDTDIQTDIEL